MNEYEYKERLEKLITAKKAFFEDEGMVHDVIGTSIYLPGPTTGKGMTGTLYSLAGLVSTEIIKGLQEGVGRVSKALEAHEKVCRFKNKDNEHDNDRCQINLVTHVMLPEAIRVAAESVLQAATIVEEGVAANSDNLDNSPLQKLQTVTRDTLFKLAERQGHDLRTMLDQAKQQHEEAMRHKKEGGSGTQGLSSLERLIKMFESKSNNNKKN